MSRFKHIAVVGAGLIGGSIVLGAARRKLAPTLTCWSRSDTSRKFLRQNGIAQVYDTAAEAVRGADLVVIATPVDRMAETCREIGPALSPGALVTDVGSVKTSILKDASHLPPQVTFIGSHPMAGSEKAGATHAQENLFQDRLCFITPTGQESAQALEKIQAFWTELGSRLFTCSAQQHDAMVATVSHVPHAAASALILAVASLPDFNSHVAGSGLKDTTRVAGGEENLWTGILLANSLPVTAGLAELEKHCRRLRLAIEQGNAQEVSQFLKAAKIIRQSLD
jgi:prephenate dehydrogenase